MTALVAPLALLIERWLGYPPALLRAIGHPVMWMGALIAFLERQLNRPELTPGQRRANGALAHAVLLAVTLMIAWPLTAVVRLLPLGWLIEALLATTLLAQKDLGRAVRAVAAGLEASLTAGREAVRHIVGRDPEALDEPAVARAAVESLAESSSDGVIAPLVFLVLLGLPGIALYKAINTADSMVGHLDERYRHYGWASARLDDLANWIPARLTALLIAGAAAFTPGADGAMAWRTARRDAPRHASPNAGWPEAAMAGALGFALGGARSYGGVVVDLPEFGTGRRDLGAMDIRAALRLYWRTMDLALVGAVVVMLVRLGW